MNLRDVPGEQLHLLGREGARRAKQWLDSTTRVNASWTVYDSYGVSKLNYDWPGVDESYSYDIGGLFSGEELEGEAFLVECKKYSTDNQGDHFDKFLAQSYVTLRDDRRLADHFMWITWHPFRIKSWTELHSQGSILKALKRERERVFGEGTAEEAVEGLADAAVIEDLAKRIWVIVLSDRQEGLVISTEDRADLAKQRMLRSA